VSGDPFLETERLILRRLVPADAELLFDLDSDPEVRRYVHAGAPDLERIRAEILPRMCADYGADRGFWAAELKPEREFVGWFHLRPEDGSGDAEVGYRLRRAVWGRGLATEGVRALVDVALAEPATARVIAVTLVANGASRRVLEKVGFERAEEFVYEPPPHAEAPPDEERRRAYRYVLTRSEPSSHAPERTAG
jgi:RimJ/RimL family protein N-acetyltransferase